MTVRFAVYLVLILTVSLKGFLSFKKLSQPFKVLSLFLGLTFISESLSRILILYVKNSMPVYHFYSIIQHVCFCIIFYLFILKKSTKKLIIISIPLMTILGILNTIYIQPFNRFPSNFLIIMLTIHITFCLLILKQIFEEVEYLSNKKANQLLLISSTLIYSAIVIVNFGLTNYFLNLDIDNIVGRNIVYYTSLAYYIMIGYTFTIEKRNYNQYAKAD